MNTAYEKVKEEVIRMAGMKAIKSFRHTRIMRLTSLPENEVIPQLAALEKEGIVRMKKQPICPNCYRHLTEEEAEYNDGCMYCGAEFEVEDLSEETLYEIVR